MTTTHCSAGARLTHAPNRRVQQEEGSAVCAPALLPAAQPVELGLSDSDRPLHASTPGVDLGAVAPSLIRAYALA